MKAILLAAGVGSRIAENIGNIPKSLMEVGDKPLIIHTVELLQKNGMDVVIITGFKHGMIEEALRERGLMEEHISEDGKSHAAVKVYYNPFYAVTNSIGSLWYARDEFGGKDIFIANADVFYTQELLDKVFAAKYDNFLLSDVSRADEGDYFFLTENNSLKKYGKKLTRDERNAEYVGIAVLRKEWVKRFRDRLCSMIEAGENDLWWEDVLYSFVDDKAIQSIAEQDKPVIHTVDVDGVFWSEIDTIEDYRRVVEFCQKF